MEPRSASLSQQLSTSGTPVCPEAPHMSEEERQCFRKWIPKGGRALEFGMGGSTRFFLESGIGHLTSVESDPGWFSMMCSDPFCGFFMQKKRLVLLLADIGPVQDKNWGRPSLPVKVEWLRYHQEVWTHIAPETLDLILIDGRFRVACCCQALLRCPQNPPLLIHDFTQRPEYHVLLDFVDIIDAAGSIIVVRQKNDVDWKRLALLLQKAQFLFE